MSCVNTIYNLPIDFDEYGPDDNKSVIATLEYNNHTFSDVATCHPSDKKFYSFRVGKNIARFRVRINVLEWAYAEAQNVAKIKKQFAREIKNQFPTMSSLCSEAMELNVEQAERNAKNIKKSLNIEKRNLAMYLAGQKAFIEKVRANRKAIQDMNEVINK